MLLAGSRGVTSSKYYTYNRAFGGAQRYGRNSTDPVMPKLLAYLSNNASNLFLLFGGI